MNTVIVLIGSAVALLLGFSAFGRFSNNKNNQQENLLKQNLDKDTAAINNNNAALKQEETVRTQLQSDINETKSETPTPNNVVQFFNDRK